MALVRCYLDFADAEFTRDSQRVDPQSPRPLQHRPGVAGSAGNAAQPAEVVHPTCQSISTKPGAAGVAAACRTEPVQAPQRPQHRRHRAAVGTGESAAGRLSARLPVASDGGRLLRPTPYRYSVLIERAKQPGDVSRSRSKRPSWPPSKNAMPRSTTCSRLAMTSSLAGATVDLQALRVTEAEGGVKLAELQQDRAATQRDTIQEWIDAGLNQWEQDMLQNYKDAKDARNSLARARRRLDRGPGGCERSVRRLFGNGVRRWRLRPRQWRLRWLAAVQSRMRRWMSTKPKPPPRSTPPSQL